MEKYIKVRKYPIKGFCLVIIKIQKHHYNTMAIIIHATKPTKQIKSN